VPGRPRCKPWVSRALQGRDVGIGAQIATRHPPSGLASCVGMFGRAQKHDPPERKQPHWLLPPLVGGLIGAVLTAAITTSVLHKAWDLVSDPFKPKPTTQELIVRQFESGVGNGGIWVGKPILFPPGSDYFLHHFSELDPRQVHPFRPSPNLIRLGEVVEQAPDEAGEFFITFGRVLTSNVPTDEPDVQDTLLQIVESRVSRPTPSQIGKVVYCRVPLRPGTRYIPGEPVFVEGVIMGAGNIQFNDGGYRPAAYMACASVARPVGRCGHGAVPPEPGAPDCGPYPRRSHKIS
jgi:hypothetical protein